MTVMAAVVAMMAVVVTVVTVVVMVVMMSVVAVMSVFEVCSSVHDCGFDDDGLYLLWVCLLRVVLRLLAVRRLLAVLLAVLLCGHLIHGLRIVLGNGLLTIVLHRLVHWLSVGQILILRLAHFNELYNFDKLFL